MLSKSLIQFSIDGWSCIPSLFFTWSQTMVEVMKTMVTSFKMSHAHTATLSAPNSAAGHLWHMPPPETPGHSWASLDHSLVESLLLSPRSWCTPSYVCALQESISQSCVRWMGHGGEFWQNVVHRRREGQTTSVFLPGEPHEQYEKAKKIGHWKMSSQVSRCSLCYWRTVENNTKKEWRDGAKTKTTPSCGCDWWWK